MSERRIKWRKAVEANHIFLGDKGKGEEKFKSLIDEYGDDGMIFYEWGEAYEFWEDYKKAVSCFIKARRCFKHVDHWKMLSDEGRKRVSLKKQNSWEDNCDFGQWTTYHQIHTLKYIDAIIKLDSYIALTMYDSEPRITALLFRACLESIVISLLPKLPEFADDDLDNKIVSLQKIKRMGNHPLDPITFSHMNKVRKIGNDAAHPDNRKHLDFRYFQESLASFYLVAQWANIESKC